MAALSQQQQKQKLLFLSDKRHREREFLLTNQYGKLNQDDYEPWPDRKKPLG